MVSVIVAYLLWRALYSLITFDWLEERRELFKRFKDVRGMKEYEHTRLRAEQLFEDNPQLRRIAILTVVELVTYQFPLFIFAVWASNKGVIRLLMLVLFKFMLLVVFDEADIVKWVYRISTMVFIWAYVYILFNL